MRILLTTALAVMLFHAPAQAQDGRRVDFGPWNGVVDCESGGNAQAINAWSGAAGLFQFIGSTWDVVAHRHDRPRLAAKHPTRVTAAQQLRQAIRLRDMSGGGIYHWVCGYRYNDGTGPLLVTNERAPRHPHRCKRNLIRKYDVSRRAARSVCGVS